MSDLADLLFYKGKGDEKTLDPAKIATLLGFGIGASGAFEPYVPQVGWQGSVPRYKAVREPVSSDRVDNAGRRPGSTGRRYFSDITYVPEDGDEEAARLGAQQQADNIGGISSLPSFGEIAKLKGGIESASKWDSWEGDRGQELFDKWNPRGFAPHLENEKMKRGWYHGPADGGWEYGTGPWAEETGAFLDEFYGGSLSNFQNNPYDTWDAYNIAQMTSPSDMDKTKPIPGISEGLAGLSGQKGLADGGILGLKTGNPPQDEGNWFTNTLNTAKDYVSGGLESLGGMFSSDPSGPNKGKNFFGAKEWTYPGGIELSSPKDLPDNKQAFSEYLNKYGQGDTAKSGGYGDVLDPSIYTMDNLKTGFTNVGDADQRAAYNALSFDDQQRIQGTYQDDPFKQSDAEGRRDKAAKAYRDQVVGKGHDYFGTPGDRDIEAWAFGSEDVAGNPDHPNYDIYSQKLYTDGDLVGFTDPDTGKFRPLTYNHAQTAKQMGIVEEAPDTITTPDTTTATTTSGNWPTLSSMGMDLSTATPDSAAYSLNLVQGFSTVPVAEQTSIINNLDKIAKGESTNEYWTASDAATARNWLQKVQKLKEKELQSLITELTSFSEMKGAYGQEGMAHGGGIKGYSFGGMDNFKGSETHSGLLKSSADGMGDTIPAETANGDPLRLAGGEYIMDAEIVSMLGNGNTDAGAQVLDDFRENVRMAKHGGEDQGKEINPENFLSRLQQTGVA